MFGKICRDSWDMTSTDIPKETCEETPCSWGGPEGFDEYTLKGISIALRTRF